MLIRFLRTAAIAAAYVIAGLVLIWTMGALWYDFPLPAAARHGLAIGFLVAAVWFGLVKSGKSRWITAGLTVLVMGWWVSLKPSNTRPWLPDVDRTAWAEIHGDEVTLHHVRNFDYRTETDFTPHWNTRTVRLSRITGIDLAINYWGSPYMAHPIVSFQFADGPPLCFSIETRKEKGESYSAIGGIYRQYELIYIVAEERDVIRVRTNYRKGEDVYLYRVNITADHARERFMEYVNALNHLHESPMWYHALTTNCTTSIRTQHSASKRGRWDWRLLVNGKADEWLYETHAIGDGKIGFPELRRRSLIDEDAKAADDDPDFSARIRARTFSFMKTTR